MRPRQDVKVQVLLIAITSLDVVFHVHCFSMLIWRAIVTVQHMRLWKWNIPMAPKIDSFLLMWPAQFDRKLVLGTRRKWPRLRSLPPETETLTIFFKMRRVVVRLDTVSRPRCRDWNHNLDYSKFQVLRPSYKFTGNLRLMEKILIN